MKERTSVLVEASTRRDAVRRLGGGSLAAAALLGGLRGAGAQEATPTPAGGESREGLYVVIRVRKVAADKSAEELAAKVREGFVPLVMAVPGFRDYLITYNAGTRQWTAINVFADKAGAEETNKIAADWTVTADVGSYVEGDPVVIDGEIIVATDAMAR